MSWPRQGSQNPLDNRECKWKTSPSWVWGFEVCMPKGSFEVAPSPQISFTRAWSAAWRFYLDGRQQMEAIPEPTAETPT